MRKTIPGLAAFVFLLAPPVIAIANIPTSMTVQGRLIDGSGDPIPAGPKTLTFKIFDAEGGGTEIWPGGVGEDQVIVSDDNGLWSASVGSIIPLTTTVFTDTARWLEVTVDDGVNPPETLPRLPLNTTPYAFQAASSRKADSADVVAGGPFLPLSGGVMTGAITSTGDPAITMGKGNFGTGNTNVGSQAFVAGESNDADGDHATVSGGTNNSAPGLISVIGGGSDNSAALLNATVGGGAENTAGGIASTVAGGFDNAASGLGAAIGGGQLNSVAGTYGFVGGGDDNSAAGQWTTVAGGRGNLAFDSLTSIVGGESNRALGLGATIGGGGFNRASGDYSVIGGGGGPNADDSNSASGSNSTVGGGGNNVASGDRTTIGGGRNHTASANDATVSGGNGNVASNFGATVGGGSSNVASGNKSTVAGGQQNGAMGTLSSVGGGILNIASGVSSTIAGGDRNQATADRATIGGGHFNRARGENSVICGGGSFFNADSNFAGGKWCVVGGGARNYTTDSCAVVDGGTDNLASGAYAAIGGGTGNTASGIHSTIGGGETNTASQLDATVGGGFANTASGFFATVGGGQGNRAIGDYAAVCGGLLNVASGDYSFSAGRRANADNNGCFVWADNTNAEFISTANNQFLIRASGGVGIGINSPDRPLHVQDGSAGVVTGNSNASAVFERDDENWIHILSPADKQRGILFGSPANSLMGSIRFNPPGAGKGYHFRCGNNSIRLVLDSLGNLTADGCIVGSNIACTSDGRLKCDVETLTDAIDSVEKLRGVSYQWKIQDYPERELPSGEQIGLIAQEVREVVPQAVIEQSDGYLAVDYARLVPLLIEAVKEQQKMINQDRDRIALLEQKLKSALQ